MTKSRSASSSAGRTPLRIRADAPGASGDLTTRPAPVATVRRAWRQWRPSGVPRGQRDLRAQRRREDAWQRFQPVHGPAGLVPAGPPGPVLRPAARPRWGIDPAAATQQAQPLSKSAEILLELVTRSVPDRAGAPLARQDFAGSRRRRYC